MKNKFHDRWFKEQNTIIKDFWLLKLHDKYIYETKNV